VATVPAPVLAVGVCVCVLGSGYSTGTSAAGSQYVRVVLGSDYSTGTSAGSQYVRVVLGSGYSTGTSAAGSQCVRCSREWLQYRHQCCWQSVCVLF